MRRALRFAFALAVLLSTVPAAAQRPGPAEDVLGRIRREGTEHSRIRGLGEALLDSIGPRLTGSPALRAANDWLVDTYRGWGIPARNEQYGTWRGWRRGTTHLDMLQPRVRTLDATMLAWSAGTPGPVEGEAIPIPRAGTAAAWDAWLAQVRGRFVLLSFPQPTCRPDESWRKWATTAQYQRMQDERRAALEAWRAPLRASGMNVAELLARLADAGALGVLTSSWAGGWGANTVFDAGDARIPMLDLSCEDFGLVSRLAEHRPGPRLRLDARSEFPGEVPVFNTVAELRGREKPDEYVVLSAHLDSWDSASGATDNGTGTLVMLEAMRILRASYPHPRRTILAGHWSGEEQGLNGSRAFAADHPEVVKGLQLLLNQDNGTGRISRVSMQGLTGAGSYLRRWLARVPPELAGGIAVEDPGTPASGGSDFAAFVCAGAPAFMLSSDSWDYGPYTWHTNLDTADKISWENVRDNAVVVAMLAYLASEEPSRVPRTRIAQLPPDPRTADAGWPACREPVRSSPTVP